MSKPTYKRSARVSDQMKEEIADILMRKIRDPRIGFVSVLGAERDATMAGLERAAPFIRTELGKRMRMKFVPELLFRYDESAERGAHVMELLHDIEEQERGEKKGDE
jgi:ribosome-binding factor A